MKKCIVVLCVLMISFLVSACGSTEDSSALFTVGGVVSGLTGTVVLQNNGGDDLTVGAKGPFTFPTEIAPGSGYTVTVRINPAKQTCLVSNGTGTILISSVTNVSVDCFERGSLDLTFNSPSGFVVQNNAAGGNGDDSGNAVAIDSRGRILSAGTSTNSEGNTDMVVWRFNNNGTPDTGFGANGIVTAAAGTVDESGNAIAIDSAGKILVTGSSKSTAGNTNMVVWRFNDDGTLDTDFGVDGIVSAAVGTGDESGNAIAIDSAGKILVTGSSKSTTGNTNMVVWRFNPNGTIDTDFNKSGISSPTGTGEDSGNAIAVDSQDRILVAGSRNITGNKDMVVWRFNKDGTLDTTFHNTGFGNGDDSGNAIAIDSQGRIVVTGSSRNTYGDTDMVVWRFKTDGNPDTDFGGDGVVVDNGAAGSNGDDSGRGVAIDSLGRILVTGTSKNTVGNTDMVIWRFNDNGAIDTSFAAYGIAVHNGAAGGSGDDSGNAIAIDSQGKIVVTGSSKNTDGNSDMVIWRLFP